MSLCIDTNVISYIFKGDSRGADYLPILAGHRGILSFMTVAELDRWALESGWGKSRKEKLAKHLRRHVIYPYDREVCSRWADICYAADRKGRPIGEADAWIAATALVLDYPLVTHNPSDFAAVDGLRILTA